MSMRRSAAVLACFLLAAMAANAASRNNAIQIKVVGSETRSLGVDDNNGVPLNCEQLTFDAYCRSSRTAPLVNTLVVQEGDKPPFRIRCTAESKLSKCTPLEAGSSFDARREKRGIVVYYTDDKGKLKSQLYTLVAEEKGDAAKAVAAPASAVPASAASAAPAAAGNAAQPATEREAPATSGKAVQPAAGNAVQPATAKAAPAATGNAVQPAAQTSGVVEAATPSHARQTVKCSFTSTPAGAEITVDGRYVGSTPSVLGLTTGTHVVVVSTVGFAQWKRELAVEPGSELTVNAVLEKAK